MGEGQKRYLVLAREDLTNQVEGRALTNKTTAAICKFLIEDVICRYGCIGKIVVDRGELDAEEAEELFDQLDVKLSLTTAYNPEANGKIEWGHSLIVKAIVHECEGRVGDWLRLLPYALWADRTTQFGDRVHVGRTYVWIEAHHAGGVDDRLLDGDRLGQQNEPRRVASIMHPPTRAKVERRGTGHGKSERSENPEQGQVRLNTHVPDEEDPGRRLGISLLQQPRQPTSVYT